MGFGGEFGVRKLLISREALFLRSKRGFWGAFGHLVFGNMGQNSCKYLEIKGLGEFQKRAVFDSFWCFLTKHGRVLSGFIRKCAKYARVKMGGLDF